MKIFPEIGGSLKRLLSKINDISLFCYGFIFVVVILVLGCIYFSLTPSSNGIGSEGKPIPNLSHWDALYFSVVTVSSLGYGDMHPMGSSKVIASVEVLFGLLIMGIMLAKLTSARLVHHVRWLYASEVRKRFDDFISEFDHINKELHSCISNLGNVFQRTPGRNLPGISVQDQISSVNACSKLFSQLHLRIRELKDFATEETDEGAFISIVPERILVATADSVNRPLSMLEQLVSLSPESKLLVLNNSNRMQLNNIGECSAALSEFMIANCKNDNVRTTYSQLVKNSSRICKVYYTTPHLHRESQPDQLVSNNPEPIPNTKNREGKK